MRQILCLLLFAVASLVTLPAWAGPYLNTSAMLLNESDAAGRWVRANLGDKELARNAHKMAQARLDVASKMVVPKEVREAHPHLLLALAAMERAMEAAAEGEVSTFVRQLQTSSGEAKTFKAVLKGLGFSLPEMRRTSSRHQPGGERLAVRGARTGLPLPVLYRSPLGVGEGWVRPLRRTIRPGLPSSSMFPPPVTAISSAPSGCTIVT